MKCIILIFLILIMIAISIVIYLLLTGQMKNWNHSEVPPTDVPQEPPVDIVDPTPTDLDPEPTSEFLELYNQINVIESINRNKAWPTRNSGIWLGMNDEKL